MKASRRLQAAAEAARVPGDADDVNENTGEVTFAADGKSVLTYVSPAIRGLCGWNPSQLVGRSLTYLVAEQDLDVLRKALARVSTGREAVGSLRVRVRGGGARWMRLRARSDGDGDGRGVLSGVLVDDEAQHGREEAMAAQRVELEAARSELEARVRERTRELIEVNESLRESIDNFSALARNASDGIVITDSGGRFVYANSAALRITGYTLEEMLEKTDTDIVDPAEAAGMRELFKRGTDRVTVWIRSKTGSRIPMEIRTDVTTWRCRPAIMGVMRDISERLASESALRRHEAQRAAIIEGMPAEVFGVNVDGRCFLQNTASRERWGELQGRDPRDATRRPKVRRAWKDGIARALDGEIWTEKVEWGRGRSRSAFMAVFCPVRVGGRVEGALVMHIDITAREAMERELAGYRNELEKLVDRRTRQLERVTRRLQAQLQEGRRLQEEILNIGLRERQRVGRDLHDTLGQQLAGVALLNKALERDIAKDAPRHLAALRRIGQLVTEAARSTRAIARGLTPVDQVAEGLAAALEDLAARTQRIFGIACRFEARGETRIRDHDVATQVYYIVQEAVTNAVRHSGATRIRVVLARAGCKGKVTVADDGRGMKRGRGRREGLGLRIMEYRAGMIGARIAFASGRDGGTAVTCTFDDAGA